MNQHKEQNTKHQQGVMEERFYLELFPGNQRIPATDDGIATCLNDLASGSDVDLVKLVDEDPEGVEYIKVTNVGNGGAEEYLVEIRWSSALYRQYIEDRGEVMEMFWMYIEDESLPDLSDWMDVSDEME